jgi:tetratricopeptide (TPR) repeat protein
MVVTLRKTSKSSLCYGNTLNRYAATAYTMKRRLVLVITGCMLLSACGNETVSTIGPRILPTYNPNETIPSRTTIPIPIPTAISAEISTPLLPTADIRDAVALCSDIDTAWAKTNWPVVIESLEKVRDQNETCYGTDPILKLYPAYYNYGAWLQARGRRTDAIQAYQQALLINPKGTEAAQALQRINAFTQVPVGTCADTDVTSALKTIPAYEVQGTGDFVKIEAGKFVGAGQLFKIRGVNYYPVRSPWRRFLTHSDLQTVATELDLIKATGFNTLRIFLWYDALFDCPGSGVVPKPEAFKRLDGMIKLAADRGFRLLVTLNDLPDLTIRPLYLNPEIPSAQTAYIVSRYRDEPAIFAWDVRNEGDIDYFRNGFSSKVVLGWLAKGASQIRDLDPNHLITAGWLSNPQMTEPAVDFVSFHHWTDQQTLKVRIGAVRVYTQKPILVEEIGYSTLGVSEAQQGTLLRNALQAAESTGAAGWLIWTAFDYPTDATCIPPACPSKDNGEHHFGLWRTDYTPKPAVEILKSLNATP